MMENKKSPNDVLPLKIDQRPTAAWVRKIMKGGEEMADKNLFNTVVAAAEKKIGKRTKVPWGVDNKVYDGVRVGIQAIKDKQSRATKVTSKTDCLNVVRWNQRLFTLSEELSEEQAAGATVALNGTSCVVDRDYTISGNVLNWTSDRNLYKSDVIAARWLPQQDAPVLRASNLQHGFVARLNQLELTACGACDKIKKNSERIAELAVCVEVLDDDYEEVSTQVRALKKAVSSLETASVEVTATATEAVPEEDTVPEPEEEEEMIESGVKVYHRLSDEGPWIVVQSTVLNINSRQECDDKSGDTYKQGFVENAWTVQTPDGVKDYPEVVLTTRKPKAVGMSLPKKIALGVGAVVVAAAVVHAPLLLQLIGAIN